MSVDHVGHSVESVGHVLGGWCSALAAERAEAAKLRAAERVAKAQARVAAQAERRAARQEKLEEAVRRRVAAKRKPMIVQTAKPGIIKLFMPKLQLRLPNASHPGCRPDEVPKNVSAVHLRLKGAGVAKIRRVPARLVNIRLGGVRTLELYGAH